MKKIVKSSWTAFCIILLFVFVISCFSAFIPPLRFSYITFFALAFPYLFALTLITAIINLYINKKMGIVILLCMPPALFNLSHVVAFNFPKKFSDKKNDNTLRIMTWNVQDFVDLSQTSDVRSNMLGVIRQKDPDILCIQEFTNVEGGRWRVSVRHELDSMGYHYYFLSNDWTGTNKHDALVTRGVAIFSKTPVTDSGRIGIRNDGVTENLIYINTEFNDRLIRIYTAHLASYALFKDTDRVNKDIYEITYDRKRAIQYKLREVEQLHQEEAQAVYDTVSKAVFPVVYCGDMNTTPCSYTYHLLKNEFNDAFLEKGSGIGATFYKILPMLRIDYCLVDPRLKVEACTVIKQKLSDHYPVVADIQWK